MKREQNEEVRANRNGDEAQSSSRRKFLRTSSATALVTSLAAQPVWAQCSPGGSAASQAQDNDDSCVIPSVAGRSPDFWTQGLYIESAESNRVPAVNSYMPGAGIPGFPSVKRSDAEKLRSYVENVMASNSYTIHGTSELAPTLVINIADALRSWGRDGNLAAIWLNAYFAFFDNAAILPGRPNPTPQDWVEHFYALYELGGDSVFSAVYSSVATTAWTLPDGYTGSP